MKDWILALAAIVAAAGLFLIAASFREYRRSLAPVQSIADDTADARRRSHKRRSLNLAMLGLQVLFALLLGVILLAGLPKAGALAVLVLCVVVQVAVYRLSVVRDRLSRGG